MDYPFLKNRSTCSNVALGMAPKGSTGPKGTTGTSQPRTCLTSRPRTCTGRKASLPWGVLCTSTLPRIRPQGCCWTPARTPSTITPSSLVTSSNTPVSPFNTFFNNVDHASGDAKVAAMAVGSLLEKTLARIYSRPHLFRLAWPFVCCSIFDFLAANDTFRWRERSRINEKCRNYPKKCPKHFSSVLEFSGSQYSIFRRASNIPLS